MPFTHLFSIGRDAELRYAGQNQTAVVNLSLAYPFGQKDQSTGKRPTQWVDASLWGKRAEVLSSYLTRGTKVVATIDELHIENFTHSDGSARSKLVGNIIAIELAGSPQQAAPAQAPAPAAPRPAPRPAPKPAPTGFDDMDDDIPF